MGGEKEVGERAGESQHGNKQNGTHVQAVVWQGRERRQHRFIGSSMESTS